jgi:hypothetical protein
LAAGLRKLYELSAITDSRPEMRMLFMSFCSDSLFE